MTMPADPTPADDQLLPTDPATRGIARAILASTRDLPIISPHTHLDASIFATDQSFGDPAIELITRDHYLVRMLYSQGVALRDLGRLPLDDGSRGPTGSAPDGRQVWRTFSEHFHLFRGTPSRTWLEHTLTRVLGLPPTLFPLSPGTADASYDHLCTTLQSDAFRPRALYDRFGIAALATTDAALDPLDQHAAIRASDWYATIVPTFRPDGIIDPDDANFVSNLHELGELTGSDTTTWRGYLTALRSRRLTFIEMGATATDHGAPSAMTADLGDTNADALFQRVRKGQPTAGDAELFRAQMLTEMAAMSLDDGLVMQIHAGAWRNHNPLLQRRFGPDMGADIPRRVEYVEALKPLLDRFGNETALRVVIYTLDESTYSRELAPLAGHYPALRLGPPWWFHDSPDGMRRHRLATIGTAGFYNTVGFNDDARSLLTIPARHDMARRMDAGFLAGLVADGRLGEDEAFEVAADLAHGLAARSFGFDR